MAQAGVHGGPICPKEARSIVLTPLKAAAIVASHKQILPPFDGVLFAFQPQIPSLTRSSLHRLLEQYASTVSCR